MTADTTHHLLFVYGSLKRGQANHAELRGARFVGVARTPRAFALRMIDGYPALVPGECAVHGELYRLTTLELSHLDAFEGDGYRRQELELEAGVRALSYVATLTSAGVPYPGDEWPAP